MAAADGIEVIVATPHVDDAYQNPAPDLIRELTRKLNELIAGEKLPLQVLAGSEVRAGSGLVEALQAGQVLTLGDSRHVLVELPGSAHATYAGELFFRLQVAGYVPVLAHVERVALFRDQPRLLEEFHERGYVLQVNAEGLSRRGGWFRNQYVKRLLRQGLVDVVASDAHNIDDRKPLLSVTRRALRTDFVQVVEVTPRRLLGI